MAKRRLSYVVLEAEFGDLPGVVLVTDEIFEEDGKNPANYFAKSATNARVAGTATIETDAEFMPFALVHLPPVREKKKP